MNSEMAYLLGMITGNGQIRRGNNETNISIEIPHKKEQTESENDVRIYVKASIADIRTIVGPLLGIDLSFTQSNTVSSLSFTKKNEDYVMREILRLVGYATSQENMRISEEVFHFSLEQRKQFIRGFADVTGYIRRANVAFGQEGQHRVYFEVPRNWHLVVDFCNLLKSVNIPVQNIDWAHPNIRDGKRTKYDQGNKHFWKKEHQIKVWAIEYLPIGFGIIHKQEALEKFAEEQQRILKISGEKKINTLHKFYWEKTERRKEKPHHPAESDEFIPEEIRGKHFDSWQEIAKELGYKE